MKKKLNIKKGFTLVEMLLYVAISGLFLTSVVSFAWDVIYGRIKSDVHQEVNNNARMAANRIDFELRNAIGINSVTPTSISLQMADSSRNPTIINLTGGRIKVGYGATGNCTSASPCNLTSNLVTVTNLTFTNLSQAPDSLNVKYQLTVTSSGDSNEFDKSETVFGSAELRSN